MKTNVKTIKLNPECIFGLNNNLNESKKVEDFNQAQKWIETNKNHFLLIASNEMMFLVYAIKRSELEDFFIYYVKRFSGSTINPSLIYLAGINFNETLEALEKNLNLPKATNEDIFLKTIDCGVREKIINKPCIEYFSNKKNLKRHHSYNITIAGIDYVLFYWDENEWSWDLWINNKIKCININELKIFSTPELALEKILSHRNALI